MSMYDDYEMDELFDNMTQYIKKYGMVDFIQIVADVVRYSSEEQKHE